MHIPPTPPGEPIDVAGTAGREPGAADARPLAAPATPKSPHLKFSKTLLNVALDTGLLVGVIVLGWISILMQVVFPNPTAADGWRLWGLSYDQWHDIQFKTLAVCALIALEHLVLHWKWVCSVLATQVFRVKNRPDEGTQAVYGVGLFIIVMLAILGSVIAAILTVRAPPR